MDPAFPSTAWTDIARARDGDRTALGRVLQPYRAPIERYLRALGRSPQDSEDLASTVLLRFLERDILQRVDRAKGRFRSLVFAVTRYVLREDGRRRRGGGRGAVSLDQPLGADDARSLAKELASPPEDETFDRAWLGALLARALDRLAAEERAGRHRHHELIRLRLDDRPVAEIAAALGRSPGAVKVALHEARRKLLAFLDEEVRAYAYDARDFAEEIATLRRFWPRILIESPAAGE